MRWERTYSIGIVYINSVRYVRYFFHKDSQTKSAGTDWLSLAIKYGPYSMHSTNSFDMHLFIHTHFIECFFYNIADIFPTYSHFGILFALNYLFALILSVVKVTLQVKWCNKMVISIVLDLRNADQSRLIADEYVSLLFSSF